MDVLVYLCKGISARNLGAMKKGNGDQASGLFVADALFSTLTNVNFDNTRFREQIRHAIIIRDALPRGEGPEHDACTWKPENDAEIMKKALETGVLSTTDEDIRSLRELLVYGLKGAAAYYHHAAILGYTNDSFTEFIQRGLASTLVEQSVPELITLVLECGATGVKILSLLDTAHTKTFGIPGITTVKTTVRDRPGILVTGHDLKDLKELLDQTRGTSLDVYTHGEMLPAHAYPAFKGYDHLAGNYGSSWWHQKEEFDIFNGPILVTTNCIVPPKDSYIGRIYTTGPTGYPGTTHIPSPDQGAKDFSVIIRHAKTCMPPQPPEGSGQDLVTGCAHDAVLSLAGPVIDAIRRGDIKRFVVMAGCNGRQREREYYTAFARALPENTVILTAGCAKYRYNSLDLGTIDSIPRVLDAGQCNDSYSLVIIAQALAGAFDVGINDLPISYNIAWYEQKAVLVLLALLHLRIRDITLGPKLPAFVSPAVLNVLVKKFGIRKNGTVEEDLSYMITGREPQ